MPHRRDAVRRESLRHHQGQGGLLHLPRTTWWTSTAKARTARWPRRAVPDAPLCQDCHSPHGTLGKLDSASPTYSRNVPALCAKCHQDGHKAAVRYTGKQDHIVEHYRESIHGKGLLEAGLTVTANCADCHTPHHELPGRDPRSSVNRANIAETCAQCHRGIYELFTASVHSPQCHSHRKTAAGLRRLPFRPQHRAHGPFRFPAEHHGPMRPLSPADHRERTSRRSTARSPNWDT